MINTKLVDATSEELMTLTRLARLTINPATGRPYSLAQLWRWTREGAHGVRPESTMSHAGVLCSPASLGRFFDAVAASKAGEARCAGKAAPTPLRARKSWEEADRALAATGS